MKCPICSEELRDENWRGLPSHYGKNLPKNWLDIYIYGGSCPSSKHLGQGTCFLFIVGKCYVWTVKTDGWSEIDFKFSKRKGRLIGGIPIQ